MEELHANYTREIMHEIRQLQLPHHLDTILALRKRYPNSQTRQQDERYIQLTHYYSYKPQLMDPATAQAFQDTWTSTDLVEINQIRVHPTPKLRLKLRPLRIDPP